MSGNICAATNSPSPCSKATTTSSTNPAPRGASSPTTPNASHQSHPELGRRSILEADGMISQENGICYFPSEDRCCFSQNCNKPCEAEPPITQGIPTATCPSAAAETQPSATAPTPTWPQKSRLRRFSEPLILSSSTAAKASLRSAAICTVSAASTTSASGALIGAG